MIDREKTIDGINKILSETDEYDSVLWDVIALLKEPVKPKKIKGYHPPMYTLYQYKCENCESPILNGQPFCCGCGKQVKWDEQTI